jgi:hypothetical protein
MIPCNINGVDIELSPSQIIKSLSDNMAYKASLYQFNSEFKEMQKEYNFRREPKANFWIQREPIIRDYLRYKSSGNVTSEFRVYALNELKRLRKQFRLYGL